jgi:ABC-type polysaccharide/polyol phosphate export permease
MKRALITHVYQHRRYIWRNAWNDLRYHYAGTGMGVFWNVIHPLITILLYTLIFSWIFPQRARGEAYVLHLTSGLLAWRAFTDTIQRGSNAFVKHARYLKRLAIPPEVFVTKICLTGTLLLFLYYLLLLPISVWLGNDLGLQIILLPALLLALQLLAFGMALALAHLRALFPDVEQIVQAVLPLWMWTLPIVYPETVIPEAWRPWFVLNPPYSFIHSIRSAGFQQQLPEWQMGISMIVWILVIISGATIVHYHLQTEIKEVI